MARAKPVVTPTNAPTPVKVDEVSATSDEAADKGYLGFSPDKTPRENYTLAGVLAGKPTPENTRGK